MQKIFVICLAALALAACAPAAAQPPAGGGATAPVPPQTGTPAEKAPAATNGTATATPAPTTTTLAPTTTTPAPSDTEAPPSVTPTPRGSFAGCSATPLPSACTECAQKAGGGRVIEPICAACAHLPTDDLRDYCTRCVTTYGGKGCTGCVTASKLLRAINNGNKPDASDVDAVASCFSCYKRTANRLEDTSACVPCYHSNDIFQPELCGTCVAQANWAKQAEICTTACAGRDPIASQKKCFECALSVPEWEVKPYCGVSKGPSQDILTAWGLYSEHVHCLRASPNEIGGELCSRCAQIDSGSKGNKCFDCLVDLFGQGLSRTELQQRGSLCPK